MTPQSTVASPAEPPSSVPAGAPAAVVTDGQKEESSTHTAVEAVADVPEPTPAESVPVWDEEEAAAAGIDYSGDFFSYVAMLAFFVIVGLLLWWAGVHKHLGKLRGRSSKGKGKYVKVGHEDVEKALD